MRVGRVGIGTEKYLLHDPFEHKYSDGLARYIDKNNMYDETDGDVEAPTGWFGLAGRNVLVHDSQGFVTRHRFDTVSDAQMHWNELGEQYQKWSAPTIWDMLEADTEYDDVQDLYSWSTNYDAGKGPFTLFLDLIGYSQDEFGCAMYNLNDASLGYVELDKLAKALDQYTDDPNGVTEYVRQLIEAERR